MPVQSFPPLSYPVPTGVDERRGWVRLACVLGGECRPVTGHESGNRWPIKACDISMGGVALIASRRFEPGTLLALTLAGAAETVSMPLVGVSRVEKQGVHWLLGCAWVGDLEAGDLRLLLEAPPPPPPPTPVRERLRRRRLKG